MANTKNKGNLQTLLILVVIVGVVLLWLYNKKVLLFISSISLASILAFLLFIVLPIVILLCLPVVSRLYHHFQHAKQIETVRIVISRVDEQMRSDMINFFDFLNGVLLPSFAVQYSYLGAHHFVWELRSEEGEKQVYLSATGTLLNTILRNLQSVHPHLRFEKVVHEKNEIPQEFMQLKLERKWFHSIETIELDSDFGAIQYEKSLTDSLMATMDEIEGDAGVQFVIKPLSQSKQSKNRLKHRLAKVGGALFECEIRIYAQSNHVLKGIIGTIGEVNAQNNVVPESIWQYEIRRYFKNYWWNYLVHNKMPSLFFGPKMKFASYHLATLLQLPSSKLRVSGMQRYTNRRLPLPAGIPTEEEVPLASFETEDGVRTGLTEDMLRRNLLILGAGGTGKTLGVATQAIPYLIREDQASIIIASNPNEAKDFLSLIPPHKKVYVIDMDTPGEWGINFLSDDETPADIMVENLVGMFQTIFDSKIKNMDFIGQAYLALRMAREHSVEWKKAVPTIDLRHIKEVLANEKYRLRLIQALPAESTLRRYWIERTQLIRNPRYFVTLIAPILTVFGRILQTERLSKTLCHPNTIDLKRILYEEKGVVLLHGGKWDFGFDMNAVASTMFLTHVYHTLLEQFYIPLPNDRLITNIFLDDFSAATGRTFMMLALRGGRIGTRMVASTNAYDDAHPSLLNLLDAVFSNKFIFRTYTSDDAKRWSGLMDRLEYDDFMHMTPYYGVAWFTVNGERKDPFIAKALVYPDMEKYRDVHPWPIEKRDLKLNEIVLPDLGKGEKVI